MKRKFTKHPVAASKAIPEISENEFSRLSKAEKVIIAKANQSTDPQVYLAGAADAIELTKASVTDAFIDYYNRVIENWKFPEDNDKVASSTITSSSSSSGVSFDFIHDGDYDENTIENLLSAAFENLGLEITGIDFRSVDYSMYPEYAGCIVSQCGVDFSWVEDYNQKAVSDTIESVMSELGYEVTGTDFYTI